MPPKKSRWGPPAGKKATGSAVAPLLPQKSKRPKSRKVRRAKVAVGMEDVTGHPSTLETSKEYIAAVEGTYNYAIMLKSSLPVLRLIPAFPV